MVRSIVVASGLALVLGGSALAAQPRLEVKLQPQHGSQIAGTATIVHESPPSVTVAIVLDGVFVPENRYPAGVYAGTCATLGATPVYRLQPVASGRSTTRLQVKAPKPGPYAIAVFRTDGSQTMSCGELPAMRHSGHRS
jgi:hypothetical protein